MADYRHITVLAKPDPEDITQVILYILSQTHRGSEEFAVSGFWKCSCKNVFLVSDSGAPTYIKTKDISEDNHYLFLLPDTETLQDKKEVTVPAAIWPIFRQAIEEYNKFYSGE